MTLPPDRIGDKGQRYALEILGYPDDGWNVVALGNLKARLVRMSRSLMLAPGADDWRIIDRAPHHQETRDDDR